MCGRFTLTTPGEILEAAMRLDEVEPAVASLLAAGGRYNLCPTNDVVAVVRTEEGRRRAGLARWGLVPAWARDLSLGAPMINARAETLAEKPAFRNALRKRRCIVPASGFYEWRRRPGGGKTPMHIRRRDGRPLALAGLWERWRSPEGGGEVRSCTIITRPPNGLMAALHDRMPAILDDDGVDAWLHPDLPVPDAAAALLAEPVPEDLLEAFEVSTYVNKVGHEGPECVAAIRPAGD